MRSCRNYVQVSNFNVIGVQLKNQTRPLCTGIIITGRKKQQAAF